ncbi:hypothetical protein [Acutalibacter sp. 1XD8-36]|uniref:hypothetical protein n=1 Tax=Acutalibacter sp. 1XD8-36 TaxID=2320852 RepID=UPI0014121738|nr:hypothetical protein [Acutalibacter sp. 1XD8-36]NBJ89831.1 hypothetical protein [Acutalibacter sp. 1XD8-36]
MSLGTENGLSAADIAAVTDRNNGNGFGGGFLGEWLIAIIMMFMFPMMFGGFGGGMWGGMGGWGNGGMIAAANGALTRADLCSEFNFNGLENAVRGVTQGLCDGFYAMQNSINGLGMNVMQYSYQAENANSQRQAALMQQLCNLGYQQKDCCCDTQRSIDGVKFTIAQEDCATRNLMQSNTRDLIENQNANARAILDALTAQRLEAKDERIAEQAAKIQALQLSASQAAQNAALMAAMDANKADILRRTGNDCPIPAYVVQPPAQVTFPTNCCGNFNGGWGNTCSAC